MTSSGGVARPCEKQFVDVPLSGGAGTKTGQAAPAWDGSVPLIVALLLGATLASTDRTAMSKEDQRVRRETIPTSATACSRGLGLAVGTAPARRMTDPRS